MLCCLPAEVLVFGTGDAIRPPPPQLVRSLAASGVGLEVSNTVRPSSTMSWGLAPIHTEHERSLPLQQPARSMEADGVGLEVSNTVRPIWTTMAFWKRPA